MAIPVDVPFLDASAPVPVDRPFTRAEALAAGVRDRDLAMLVQHGLLRHPIRGVYHASQLPDGLDLRIACLRLVVPQDCVVTDRTAGWLHGAEMALAPNDHLVVPSVSVFRPPGYRLRNGLTASGERTLRPSEVVEIGGLRVTAPLRTAFDLGRMRWRAGAFAAMEAVRRATGFPLDELLEYGDRYKGYRYVRTFRELAPRVGVKSESGPESVVKLRWTDCSLLPPPQQQIPVQGPDGPCFLDIGSEEIGYAAEYDGEAFHGPERREHDRRRRTFVAENGDWVIDDLRRKNVYGAHQDVETVLIAGVAKARRAFGGRQWTRSLASPR